MNKVILSIIILFASFLFAGCNSAVQLSPETDRLQVVATTTFVGDTVEKIADDTIDLTVLLAAGENPHGYTPRPQDITRIAQADVVFANGAGLEEFLDALITNSGGDAEVVYVSDGIDFLEPSGEHPEDEHDDDEGGEDHNDEGVDPHVWLDPDSIIHWTENIESALSRLNPEDAELYRTSAQVYRDELHELDDWIRAQVDQIPVNDKKLVTDHTSFGYFAEAYGFEQVGAVIPAPTTEAEPSGQDLAELTNAIQAYGVKAIFVSVDFDQSLSERIAEETGVRLVPIYFGSLSSADGPAATYLDFMRYNVSSIVEALK